MAGTASTTEMVNSRRAFFMHTPLVKDWSKNVSSPDGAGTKRLVDITKLNVSIRFWRGFYD
jgi:hypothetical protein